MKFSKSSLSAFVVVIVLFPIVTLTTAFRFVATRRAHRKPAMEDWWSLCAWATMVLHDVAIILAALKAQNLTVEVAIKQHPEDFAVERKWIIVGFVLFYVQQCFAKLSVACLYLRIFGVNIMYRRIIRCLIALQTTWTAVPLLMRVFSCSPVHKFWYPLVEGTCLSEGIVIAVAESVNSFTDIAFVGLAMHMIRELNVSRKTKARLYVLFGLGSLAGFLGVAKIAVTYKGSTYYSHGMLAIISNVQMAVGIICCCVPVFKPLFPEAGFWKQLSPSLLKLLIRRRASPQGSSTGYWAHQSSTEELGGSGKRGQGSPNIHEDFSSSRGIPGDNSHNCETHAMYDLDTARSHSGGPGIHVESHFNVDNAK